MAASKVAAGTMLAARHASAVAVDEERSLLAYAERPRIGGWSLRSALVRLAQPHPELASAVLDSVRRCDGVLAGVARTLMSHGVLTDRSLAVTADGDLTEPREPVADTRAADLARLADVEPDVFDQRLDAYRREIALDEHEVLAIPVLRVALELDGLGDLLAEWAEEVAPGEAPASAVADQVARASAALDAMGIPRA